MGSVQLGSCFDAKDYVVARLGDDGRRPSRWELVGDAADFDFDFARRGSYGS